MGWNEIESFTHKNFSSFLCPTSRFRNCSHTTLRAPSPLYVSIVGLERKGEIPIYFLPGARELQLQVNSGKISYFLLSTSLLSPCPRGKVWLLPRRTLPDFVSHRHLKPLEITSKSREIANFSRNLLLVWWIEKRKTLRLLISSGHVNKFLNFSRSKFQFFFTIYSTSPFIFFYSFDSARTVDAAIIYKTTKNKKRRRALDEIQECSWTQNSLALVDFTLLEEWIEWDLLSSAYKCVNMIDSSSVTTWQVN